MRKNSSVWLRQNHYWTGWMSALIYLKDKGGHEMDLEEALLVGREALNKLDVEKSNSSLLESDTSEVTNLKEK